MGNEGAALEISRLDHRKPAVAEDLRRLMARAYVVEAGLIGALEFPPLHRTAEAIRAADAVFDGASLTGRLVAAVELEATGERCVHIASFVVDPDVFRRGIATRLLLHVLGRPATERVTVSTAARNLPAIRLYEKHGFRLSTRWVISEIDMVTMEWNGSVDPEA
jgi:ribosomal protein S18 acetylase RimI-like enzyme